MTITSIIKLIIAYWLPLLLTVYFNISLIIATRRSNAFRRQQFQSEADDNRMSDNSRRVTMTMIAIVIVYLVCQLPIRLLLASVGTCIKTVIRRPTDVNFTCTLTVREYLIVLALLRYSYLPNDHEFVV